MDSSNLNIFIHTHRDFESPVQNPCYKIITSTPLPEKDLEVIDESKGINLLNFNSCYSELTGFYWIWKNIKREDLSEFVGFNHYRSYFSFLDNIPENFDKDSIITFPPINVGNIVEQYDICHNIKDLDLCFSIAGKMHNEYLPAIMKTINSSYLYTRNCFIMHKDVFYSYMEWLFGILFKFDEMMGFRSYEDVKRHVDSNIDLYKKDDQVIDYQYRLEGFLSERLFTLWLNHNYPDNVIFVDEVRTETIDRYKESNLNNVEITSDILMQIVNDICNMQGMLNVEKAETIENLVLRVYNGQFPDIQEDIEKIVKTLNKTK